MKMKVVVIDDGDSVPLLENTSSIKGATLSSAIFNISTTMIGAGIMSVPATFRVLGICPAFVFIFVVALMAYATGNFLLKFTRSGKSNTYAGLMDESFGSIGSLVMQIAVMITSFGCLIIYLIIIGDVLTGSKSGDTVHIGILQEWFGFHWWTSRAFGLLFVVLFVLLPLVLFRRIDSLRYTSALSILLALVFVVISSVMAIQMLMEGKTQIPRLMPDFSSQGVFLSLFTTIPIFMTSFGYHINIHSIKTELREPSEMKLAIRISLIICAAFYFSIGFFGYLLFGDSINDDMLVNFDKYSGGSMAGVVINVIIRLSYAVHLMLVFPLMNYTLRANVDELFFSEKPELVRDSQRFVWLTCILLALVYIVAIAIPSIWYVFQILGSTTVVCLILIFPASICLRDVHGISTSRDKIVAVMLIIAGSATSIITLWVNLSSPSESDI